MCQTPGVSEEFKETHKVAWKGKGGKNKIDVFLDSFNTEARWNKAIQHMRDAGSLTHSPKDIGSLIKEIQMDIIDECAGDIKEKLFKLFVPEIQRKACKGFPEYYKQQLLEGAFKKEEAK